MLVERGGLVAWLEERKLQIVWTTLSEMQWFAPGSMSLHNLGYATHTRHYRLVDGTLRKSKGIANASETGTKPDRARLPGSRR